MAKNATATKSAPVPIASPQQDCAAWCDLKLIVKDAEKKIESLKKRMLALVPDNRTQERFPAVRNGMHGQYVVTRIEQDRRTLDIPMVMELLKKHLTDADLVTACDLTPNLDAVAQLVKEEKIPVDEFAACLKGSQPVYPTCTFEEV